MKRRELLAHMQQEGCQLLREGGRHSIWVNPGTGRKEAVPKRLISSRRKAYEQGQVATLTMDELKKSIRRPR